MDMLAVRQHIFYFQHPTVLGLPAYEFLMWGFYLLHTWRVLDGTVPPVRHSAWILAAFYSVAFATIPDPSLLLAVTAVLLTVALSCFHEREDFLYVGYMVLLGALFEYTGVLSGQWAYPGHPLGGVPLWFITLWGGVGLFLRRLLLPVAQRMTQRTASIAPDRK